MHQFGSVEGKAVLCLAYGGGQQASVFAVFGAQVTVVDISQGQLQADEEAAAHHGYEVETIHGDMRDLSVLEPCSFDIVFGTATCYVPSIREVYAQVAAVLKPDGLYGTGVGNPALQAVQWDGEAYRITKPYAQSVHLREDGGVEFRHYLDDIFNGLRDSGLALLNVEDRGRDLHPSADAPPGSYTHEMSFIAGGFDILARKKGSMSSC